MIDLAEAERVLTEALAVVRELRASLPADDVAGERLTELPEADMARRLGIDPEALRSHRRAGNCQGLWRGVGRVKLYLVAQTEIWAAEKLAGKRP